MRYIMVRMPRETYDKLIKKQKKLEEHARTITGRTVRIPRTKIMDFAVSKTWYGITDQEIRQLTNFGRKKKEVFYV